MADEPFVITLKDVYQEVQKMRGSVDSMSSQARTVTDHEARLRALERWRYALPTSIVVAAASLIVAILEGGGHG
jgi:hypothetical protein